MAADGLSIAESGMPRIVEVGPQKDLYHILEDPIVYQGTPQDPTTSLLTGRVTVKRREYGFCAALDESVRLAATEQEHGRSEDFRFLTNIVTYETRRQGGRISYAPIDEKVRDTVHDALRAAYPHGRVATLSTTTIGLTYRNNGVTLPLGRQGL